MDRRRFLRTTSEAGAAAWLIGCARSRPVGPAGPASAPEPEPAPPEPSEAPPAPEPEPPGEPRVEAGPESPAPSVLDEDFPDWNLGEDSTSEQTMLMFRGNPSHTFYGTGPLPEQPKLLWRTQLGTFAGKKVGHKETTIWKGTGWSGHPVRWGKHVFVGAVDRTFYSFHAETGKIAWKFQAERMFKGSSCFYKGRLYTGNVDNIIRCLDGKTGKLVWSYDTHRDCDSSPCVVGNRLYIGGEDGFLKCFDPDSGSLHWKVDLGEGRGAPPGSGGIESSPAVADGEIYVGHYDGYLLCADAMTGAEKWRASTGADTDVSPVVSGDRVYIAAEMEHPYLYCFDRSRKGKKVWEFNNKKGYWSTPAVVGDRLYIGGNDAVLYCLDARSGKVIWTFQAGDAIWCSPAVVDGKVAFGSYDPYFYLLDAARGKLLWKYDMGERTHSTPCIVDGKIYVGSANGWFHCFG
jgi:outer membrane protein assembly factor BamB